MSVNARYFQFNIVFLWDYRSQDTINLKLCGHSGHDLIMPQQSYSIHNVLIFHNQVELLTCYEVVPLTRKELLCTKIVAWSWPQGAQTNTLAMIFSLRLWPWGSHSSDRTVRILISAVWLGFSVHLMGKIETWTGAVKTVLQIAHEIFVPTIV